MTFDKVVKYKTFKPEDLAKIEEFNTFFLFYAASLGEDESGIPSQFHFVAMKAKKKKVKK